jgi:hypothetical protein
MKKLLFLTIGLLILLSSILVNCAVAVPVEWPVNSGGKGITMIWSQFHMI